MKTFDSIKMLKDIKHIYDVTISLADTFAVAHKTCHRRVYKSRSLLKRELAFQDAGKADMDISS